MNEKINRNCEIFSPCDFIAAKTQHIPDKRFQLVRYYGWYSNKMRGQHDIQAVEEAKTTGAAVKVIEIRTQAAPHPVGQMAGTHEESVGSRFSVRT